MMKPHCEYFTAIPDMDGEVSSDMHDAGEGPLFFFWPLPNGDALRVPVCQEHSDVLALCAGQGRTKS